MIVGATSGRPRAFEERPYRFGGGFDVVIVGTGVLDGPKRADMESAPTDLMVVLKVVCRGRYYPPAVCKNHCVWHGQSRTPAPTGLSAFDILIVGDDVLGVPFVWRNVTQSLPL